MDATGYIENVNMGGALRAGSIDGCMLYNGASVRRRGILKSFLRIFYAMLIVLPAVFFLAPAGRSRAFSPGDFEYSDSPFYIYVEKGSYSLTVFAKDADGRHTTPLRTFPTAIGRARLLTPTGVFYKGGAEDWHSWGSTYSPYASEFYPGLYVHGPIYRGTAFSEVIISSVDQIGSAASSGCLRTTAEAAYFVYAHCPAGTPIHIVEGSPIGYYATAAVAAEQLADPSQKTLAEIFPAYSDLFDGDVYMNRVSAEADRPRYTWQKMEASQIASIKISNKSIALISPSAAARAGSSEARLEAAVVAKSGGNRSDVKSTSGNGAEEDSADGNSADEDSTGGDGAEDDSAGGLRRGSGAVAEYLDEPVLWVSVGMDAATVGYDGAVKAAAPGVAVIAALSVDGLHAGQCSATVSPDGGGNAGDAVPGVHPFADVGPGHWAHGAVASLASGGIIEGGGESEFNPESDITSAEFIKLLISASPSGRRLLAARFGQADGGVAGADGSSGASGDGVGEEDWFAPYYEEAVNTGVVLQGEEPAQQLTSTYLTRESMARYTARAGWPDIFAKSDSPGAAAYYLAFKDSEDITEIEHIVKAVRSGYMSAYSDGRFRPRSGVTRAEAAVAVYNMRARK